MTFRCLTLWLALQAPAVVLAAQSQPAPDRMAPQPEPRPLVVTRGEGRIRRAPDRAWVTIAAETRAKSPRAAQRENAEAMVAVQRRLADARIPKDAVRTIGYDLRVDYEYVNGRQVPRGYIATNQIDVRVDDVERVGEILDLGVGSGATSVSGVRFDLKDRESVERDALRQAVADARARAEAAAAGAGQTLDRVIRIEEEGTGLMPPTPMPLGLMRAEAARAPETPIAAGEIEITARVTLTAALR